MSSQPSHMELSPSPFPKNVTRLILSVDDEPEILLTRQRILENAGYDVISAADGQQALDVFDSQTVDLVLLDYLMPGMNGGAVAQEMKTRNPNVSVMIVSASPVSEATLNCADCRIYKGQGPALLLEKIRQLLSRGVKAHAAVTTDTANDGGARRNKI